MQNTGKRYPPRRRAWISSIYDIPELSANRLTDALLREMAQCEDLAGVKASSETAGDVERFGEILGDNRCVMCGSDGLLCAELALGACGGIGGTYAALIEHFSALYRSFSSGDVRAATEHQRLIWHFLETAEKRQCSIYALMKEIIRTKYGIDAGSVRPPLAPVTDADRRSCRRPCENVKPRKSADTPAPSTGSTPRKSNQRSPPCAEF